MSKPRALFRLVPSDLFRYVLIGLVGFVFYLSDIEFFVPNWHAYSSTEKIGFGLFFSTFLGFIIMILLELFARKVLMWCSRRSVFKIIFNIEGNESFETFDAVPNKLWFEISTDDREFLSNSRGTNFLLFGTGLIFFLNIVMFIIKFLWQFDIVSLSEITSSLASFDIVLWSEITSSFISNHFRSFAELAFSAFMVYLTLKLGIIYAERYHSFVQILLDKSGIHREIPIIFIKKKARKLRSIKRTRYMHLSFFLILALIIFSICGIYLNQKGFLQNILEIGIFTGIVGISTAFTITIGLRIINEMINSYETYVEGRMEGLKTYVISLRDTIDRMRFFKNVLPLIKLHMNDANRELSHIVRHGQFFLTKLYPKKTLDRIETVFTHINSFTQIFKQLISDWETEFKKLLESEKKGLIFELILDNVGKDNLIDFENPIDILNVTKVVRARDFSLINKARRFKKEILQELYDIEIELDLFLQAN